MEKFREGLKAVAKYIYDTLRWAVIFSAIMLVTASAISVFTGITFAMSGAIVLTWFILMGATVIVIKVLP